MTHLVLVMAAAWFAAMAQDRNPACDNCPQPTVAIYDAHNTVPPPADPAKAPLEEITRWVRLSTADGGMRDELVNADPSHVCYRQLDAIAINAKQTGDPNRWLLPGGFAYETRPPAGPINGVQFIVHGLVEGTEGAYRYTAILESATSREEIARATAAFATASEAEGAARSAARQLFPLLGKIRGWQQRKRDETGQPICWRTEATPKLTKIEAGQSTEIDLLAYDCDGARGEKPLKGVTLNFVNVKGGVLEPSQVVTDAQGRAKVTFRAGRAAGAGVGWVTLYPATSQDGFLGDDGSFQIKIGPSTSSLWRLDTQLTGSTVVTVAPGTPLPPDVYEDFVHDQDRWNASATILLECDEDSGGLNCQENLAAHGNGSLSRNHRRHSAGVVGKQWGTVMAQGTVINGVTEEVRPKADVTYARAEQAFLLQGGVAFRVRGVQETHIDTTVHKHDDVSPYEAMTAGDFSCGNDHPGATFQASRDVYTISCSSTKEEIQNGFKYVYSRQATSTLRRVF